MIKYLTLLLSSMGGALLLLFGICNLPMSDSPAAEQVLPPKETREMFQSSMSEDIAPTIVPVDETASPPASTSGPETELVCHASNLAPQQSPVGINVTINRIIDGDTLVANTASEEMTVRLWGLDAPEMDQPNGDLSRQALAELAPPGAPAVLYPIAQDQYGRTVASISSRSVPTNVVLVANGWAYHVNDYDSQDNNCLVYAESLARTRGYGIWKNNPDGGTRPWNHRQNSGTVPLNEGGTAS